MATTLDHSAFERATDPILRFFSRDQAEQLVAYCGSESLRNRIDELADRNTEGDFMPHELAEYEAYVRANKFIAILQSQARRYLAQGT